MDAVSRIGVAVVIRGTVLDAEASEGISEGVLTGGTCSHAFACRVIPVSSSGADPSTLSTGDIRVFSPIAERDAVPSDVAAEKTRNSGTD